MSQFEEPLVADLVLIAAFGAFLILLGIGSFIIQIGYSIWKRDELRDETGDPWQAVRWNGRPRRRRRLQLRLHAGRSRRSDQGGS